VVDCGCLENSWVNSPGGSNPSPSVKRPLAFLASRAGASPAPTLDGWASHSCMVGATLAVALETSHLNVMDSHRWYATSRGSRAYTGC
jgi:hypothetical protein